MSCKRLGARTHRPFSSLEPPRLGWPSKTTSKNRRALSTRMYIYKHILDPGAYGFGNTRVRALDLSPLHAQKSSGSRLIRTIHKYEHGCARAVNSLEPISLIFSTGAVKAAPTAPPTKTSQIRQTTEDDDFVHEIIGGAIVLGMILIIYACHSCYLCFCHNRQDNAGAILNLPNMVQLPSYFPIGPPYLHKDDGITLVNYGVHLRTKIIENKIQFA